MLSVLFFYQGKMYLQLLQDLVTRLKHNDPYNENQVIFQQEGVPFNYTFNLQLVGARMKRLLVDISAEEDQRNIIRAC